MKRAIVHLDLDAFFVSCARLSNRELNGIPLIVGGSRQRGVVTCASREARFFGVHAGMPMHLALKLCNNATVIKGDFDFYESKSREVTEVIKEDAPLFEKSSIDEFYLDISGMDKYFGCLKWSNQLTKRITHETGLPISFGLSVNKTVAKIATGEGKPLGRMEVRQNQVLPFLHPLSIIKIPGIGQSTFKVLSRIGIRKIRTLSEIPVGMMEKLLGKNGKHLSQKANGIDLTPVKPYTERKSISTERTFHHDTIDVKKLKTILSAMVEKLCFQLRQEQWLTSNISVKIRYANFDTHQKQSKVYMSACDKRLTQVATELFDALYNRRMRLRLIGIRFSSLKRGSYQINLFDDTAKQINLYQAMDRIRNRYDANSIHWGTGFGTSESLRHVS